MIRYCVLVLALFLAIGIGQGLFRVRALNDRRDMTDGAFIAAEVPGIHDLRYGRTSIKRRVSSTEVRQRWNHERIVSANCFRFINCETSAMLFRDEPRPAEKIIVAKFPAFVAFHYPTHEVYSASTRARRQGPAVLPTTEESAKNMKITPYLETFL